MALVFFKELQMEKQIINIKLDEGAFTPYKAHIYDAGFDLYAMKDQVIKLTTIVDTGVHMDIPNGYVGLVFPRSSMSKNNYITPTGVIDSGYTGSIKVTLKRPVFWHKKIKEGDRIAQLVIVPVPQFELKFGSMRKTDRGVNGFGSTGI